MHPMDDPTQLSPDQRRREIAGILAQGVLRLRHARMLACESTAPLPNPPEFSAGRLEVSEETVLSVHTG